MIAEDYIARGEWPRHNAMQTWSHPDGAWDAVAHFNISEADDAAVVGHMPFFASAEEAAGVQQWLTVAALPMDDEQIVYLDAGWIDGMLALRFADVAQPMGDYDDISALWGYTLAPMGSELDVLGGGTGQVNYHGAVCIDILHWISTALDPYGYPSQRCYCGLRLGIKASTLFFFVGDDLGPRGEWPLESVIDEWDDDNRTPFCSLPDLGGGRCSADLGYVFVSGNTPPWPDDLFDLSTGLTLDNIRELWALFMFYSLMDARDRALSHRVKQVATYQLQLLDAGSERYRWLSIDVYCFDHCELVFGYAQHLY